MLKRNTAWKRWLAAAALTAAAGCVTRETAPPPPSASTPPPDSSAVPSPAPTLGDGLRWDVPVWAAAQQRGVRFRAVGNEPGWVLEVDSARGLRLVTRYGADSLVAPDPVRAGSPDSLVYVAEAEGHTVRVSAVKEPCSDPMSGEQHPYAVRVAVDDEDAYEGCGRPL